MKKSTLSIVLLAVLLAFGSALLHPRLLFFPHQRTIGAMTIYSESPIPDEIERVVGRSDALVRASPLFTPGVLQRPIYLTDGGLRWRLLTVGSSAFAISRPPTEAIVINRSNVFTDEIWNGADSPAVRDLSGVIAHERTHLLIRERFGLLASRLYPAWVVEGYCDHVAGSSTLSDEAAARLIAEGRRTPALFYYESRKRVERELAANGGSVEDLFRASRNPGR